MAHQMVGHAGLPSVCAGPDAAPSPDCPVEVALTVLRGRWMPLVLLQFLRSGELGFSELAAALPGLSDKVLSERLAQLTDAGVLARHRSPGWPPRVRYVLTDRGRTLTPVLEALWLWGAGHDGPEDEIVEQAG
ncbi:helix-turn-helix domain-containing protein [Nonomuraea sp. NPDC046802]|uniref:winged helix-turn-helix transcriptional regulator n=1 Tax=Nonomuraea sp. NPDC046802 TaxID=3154919 RepID=UPI0033C1A421